MTRIEALIAFMGHEKVRRMNWDSNRYIYFDDGFICRNQNGQVSHGYRSLFSASSGDRWEIYKEPATLEDSVAALEKRVKDLEGKISEPYKPIKIDPYKPTPTYDVVEVAEEMADKIREIGDRVKAEKQFTPEQIERFNKSAKRQIEQKGSCEGISCWDCRGSLLYNMSYCDENGWTDPKLGAGDPNPKAVESCKRFLKEQGIEEGYDG